MHSSESSSVEESKNFSQNDQVSIKSIVVISEINQGKDIEYLKMIARLPLVQKPFYSDDDLNNNQKRPIPLNDDGYDDDPEDEDSDEDEVRNRRVFCDPRFRMEKEAIVSQTRYGLLFYFLTAAILAAMILTYYREPTEPETRVTGFLEGRVYSENDDGSIRLWDIRDTQVPSYAYQQIFVPTVVRVVENQSQGRCQDRTINCTTTSDCLLAMNYLYSTRGSDMDITAQYGAAECQDGFCMMMSWCPSFSEDSYTEHILRGVLNQNIIIKGQVRDELGDEKHDEIDQRIYYPDPGANVFKVSDILNISGIREFDTVRGNGAIILLELDWNCIEDTDDDDCKKGVAARWMDQETRNGYFQYQVNYQYQLDSGVPRNVRDEMRITGLQIYLLLNADEYGLDFYDLSMMICGFVGIIYLLRNIMLFIVWYFLPNGINWHTFKYEAIVRE
ncbi:unnamed protein product [Moneuplotes crassus]|uniref:Uncharacterized protein n=1 Tax=Euplotes crassus TaxID=5936 RepID=A0AAD1UC14_EUPCR|nr:unnamed protein product [Moneuplotes crassus]